MRAATFSQAAKKGVAALFLPDVPVRSPSLRRPCKTGPPVQPSALPVRSDTSCVVLTAMLTHHPCRVVPLLRSGASSLPSLLLCSAQRRILRHPLGPSCARVLACASCTVRILRMRQYTIAPANNERPPTHPVAEVFLLFNFNDLTRSLTANPGRFSAFVLRACKTSLTNPRAMRRNVRASAKSRLGLAGALED